jgi:membrane carboxypeptidase/penicillin-binding protein PbpC
MSRGIDAGAGGEVAWLVKGRLAARGVAARPLRWRREQPGAVTVVALDGQGRFDRIDFEVLP